MTTKDTAQMIEALDACLAGAHNCRRCPYNGADDCQDKLAQDLTHRLSEAESDADLMSVIKLVQQGIVKNYRGNGIKVERSEM